MNVGDGIRDASRYAEERRKAQREYDKRVAKVRSSWVPGTELTADQLSRVQPDLRAAFYARQAAA